MKFSSMIVGAVATLATAAPAPAPELEKRSFNGNFNGLGNVGNIFGNNFNRNDFNNFNFLNQQLGYISSLGFFDAEIIAQLVLTQNLGFDNFQNLFLFQNNQNFGLEQILQLHALSLLGWCANQGFFNQINFNGALFPSGLATGLLENNFNQLGAFNLGIDANLNNQVAAIVQQTITVIKE